MAIHGGTSADTNRNDIPDDCEGDSLSSMMQSESATFSPPSTQPFRLTAELIEKIDALLAWYDANPRANYPELNDREYADLVVAKVIELGLHVNSEDDP